MMIAWFVMAVFAVIVIFIASDPKPPNDGGPTAKAPA